MREETSALRSTNERLRFQLAELTKQNKNLTVTLSNNRKNRLTNTHTNHAATLGRAAGEATESFHTSNQNDNEINSNQYNNISLDQFFSSPSYTHTNTDEALDTSYPQESTTLPFDSTITGNMGESSIEGPLTVQPQQPHKDEGNIKRYTNTLLQYICS